MSAIRPAHEGENTSISFITVHASVETKHNQNQGAKLVPAEHKMLECWQSLLGKIYRAAD